jgi:hypothetical protein
MPVGFVEWFVAVFAVLILFKAVVFNINPTKWINFWMKRFEKVLPYLRIFYLGLFFILAYYLLQEITYVQFFAAIMAGAFLIAHTMMHYPEVMKKYTKNFRNRSDLKKLLLDWIIWVALAVMVLKVLFF